MVTEKFPLIVSSDTLSDVPNLTPFPKKLFSVTPKPNEPPSLPTPAPRVISPVGFSVTSRFITLVLIFSPSVIFDFTSLKIFRDLKLFKDFAFSNSLNGSPSSISREFLITFSCVILFPKIFILST